MPLCSGTILFAPLSSLMSRSHSCSVLSAALVMACVSLMASAAQAQGVYRIVGPDGRVTFSDRAPTAAQAQPSAPPASPNAANTDSALPYALRQSAERYPVMLYSSKDCEPCDEAREYLRGRGIPFGERTIETSADVTALKAQRPGQPALCHHWQPAPQGLCCRQLEPIPQCRGLSHTVQAPTRLSGGGCAPLTTPALHLPLLPKILPPAPRCPASTGHTATRHAHSRQSCGSALLNRTPAHDPA